MVALTFRAAAGSRPEAAGGARRRPLRALGSIFSGLVAEWRLRRQIRSVEGFTDAMLQDIGLTRAGIEDAVRPGR
jgi:uncharacterized protein YjiS (DUF1127 family)